MNGPTKLSLEYNQFKKELHRNISKILNINLTLSAEKTGIIRKLLFKALHLECGITQVD